MAFGLPADAILCFMNTGKEHSKTLDFIQRLEDDIGREIHRIEFRAPPRGERPGLLTAARVSHAELNRKGEPFMDFLDCLASYRKAVKGLGPVAPWARQRMCTAYLKIKTQKAYVRDMLGWAPGYTQYVGLRYDEPGRVDAMHRRNRDRDNVEIATLYDQRVVKEDVLRFWAAKPYDLEIPEYLGNCTGCFLKDEGDLALALEEPETDAQFWLNIEANYAPMRRGTASYAQVLAEAPARRRIRSAVAEGRPLTYSDEPSLSQQRFKLLWRQEVRRSQEVRPSFSCACEAAELFTDGVVLGDAINTHGET